jgi:hypothetical protein
LSECRVPLLVRKISHRLSDPFAGLALLIGLLLAPQNAQACQQFPIVHFWSGSVAIDGHGQDTLRGFAQEAAQRLNQIRSIRVIGHSDRTGTLVARQRVSAARARAVRSFLIANGIPARVIEASGVADSQPFTESGEGVREPQNRRAEVQVTLSENGANSPALNGCGSAGPSATSGDFTASQQAEVQEIGYVQCLQAAAQHYGAIAGRAGTNARSSNAPFEDCARSLEAWREALTAANPGGGVAAAEAHIASRMSAITSDVMSIMQRAYDENNYQ